MLVRQYLALCRVIPQFKPVKSYVTMKVDYTLYLVTDSTRAILGDRDIVSVVKAAVEGGIP